MSNRRGAVTSFGHRSPATDGTARAVDIARMADMDEREAGIHDLLGTVSEAVERRAPGFVRFLAALRWGGLRTMRPDRRTWLLESAAGLGLGLGLHAGVRAATRGRVRVPMVAAAAVGGLGVHLGLWRWDTLRWRRHRVAIVVDLPVGALIALSEELDAAGIPVERWERGVRMGRRSHGLWCRTGDLREVNRRIDTSMSVGGTSAAEVPEDDRPGVSR